MAETQRDGALMPTGLLSRRGRRAVSKPVGTTRPSGQDEARGVRGCGAARPRGPAGRTVRGGAVRVQGGVGEARKGRRGIEVPKSRGPAGRTPL